MTCLINEWFRSRFSKLGQESWRVTQKVLSTQNIPCCVFMDTMFWEECMTSMHICLHISLYGYFLIKNKQIVDGRRNKYPFFSQCRWVTGVTDPSTKNWKLVSLVSPNKLAPIKGSAENGDRWHFYILFFYDLPRENR